MTCQNHECKNHQKDLGEIKFCHECGKPTVSTPQPETTGRNIIAGDQVITHSTVVHNTTHAVQPEVFEVLKEQSKALNALAQSRQIPPSQNIVANAMVSKAAISSEDTKPAWFSINCPSCKASIAVPKYNTSEENSWGGEEDKGVKFPCPKCQMRVWARKTNHSVCVLGPKDRGYSNAEDPLIGDDKKCKTCKHFVELDPCRPKEKDYLSWGLIGGAIFLYCFGWMMNWFWGYWHPWGLIGCVPIAAIGLIRMRNNKIWHQNVSAGEWCGNQTARETCDRNVESGGACSMINPNQRCKFWEPR